MSNTFHVSSAAVHEKKFVFKCSYAVPTSHMKRTVILWSSVLVKQWKWVIFLDKRGRFVQALIVLRGSLMTLTTSTHKGSGRCLLWQFRYVWRQFISKYSHASNTRSWISLSKEKLSYAQTLMFKLKTVLLWTILKKVPHVKKPSDLRKKAAHFC
jgi:hypothetical protein